MKSPFVILLSSILLPVLLAGQNQVNVELFGQFNRGDIRYSGSWTYIDLENRNEYALLGTRTGTAVYAIDELPIQEVGFIAGPPSNWREITVLGQYAYVTTEGSGEGEGMQIIDLSNLPDTVILANTYRETFTRGHIIQRDIYTDTAFVYVMGTCGNCGVQILDVTDPIVPIEIGAYHPGYYIHDAHVRGDFLYAAAFQRGLIDIVDIQDKTNPTLVAQIEIAGGNTHSSWTTEDGNFLIVSSEKDGIPASIWDISDLNNLTQVATYLGNLASLTHNPYVRGDFAFFSHNTEGLRVVDMVDPNVPVEVGFFDTFAGESGGFNGLWSACPYLPSGKIIGGNREDGLYVWTFNNTRAGRFYATVIDESTGEIIPNANFFIQKVDTTLQPELDGIYRFGTISGSFAVEVSAEGYETQQLDIRIEPGDSLTFEIALQPQTVGLFDTTPHVPFLPISPNPMQDFVVLDLGTFPSVTLLRVFNNFGQLLKTEQVIGGHLFVLERGELPSGIHVFSIYDSHNVMLANGKVVIVD